MRRGNMALLFALACGATLALVACSTTEQSGACNGTEDGTYWQMQVYNYYPNPLEVRLNGRFVGNVDGSTTNPTTGNVIPGESQLGEFPVCDALITEAVGTGVQTTKACSNAQFTSTQCKSERPDYCWVSFVASDDGSVMPPLVQPQCMAYPDCTTAWLSC